jgi:hypothetical protein
MTVSASRSFQRDDAETSRRNENCFPLPMECVSFQQKQDERDARFHRLELDKKPRPLPARAFLTSGPDD